MRKDLQTVLENTTTELFEWLGNVDPDINGAPDPAKSPFVHQGSPDDLKKAWNWFINYPKNTYNMGKAYLHRITAPDPEPGYFDQAKNWVAENPLPAAGIGLGVPIALAGSYYAYKKLKDRQAREAAGL